MSAWAVVGGSGFVGSAVVAELRGRGIPVIPVGAPRLAPVGGDSDPSAAQGAGDVSRLAAALRGCSVVVNAAGLAAPESSDEPALRAANAALPLLVARAAAVVGVPLFLHVSSAAVQGDLDPLTARLQHRTFSPYSRSKAEAELLLLDPSQSTSLPPDIAVVRATSVQGAGRRTTESIRTVASSPWSSVAGDGSRPSPVSTVESLARFVVDLGIAHPRGATLHLQPWEGWSVRDVMLHYGGKEPAHLPVVLCTVVIRALSRLAPRLHPRVGSLARRLDVLWFGQAVEGGTYCG